MIYIVLGILLIIFGGFVGASITIAWVDGLLEKDFEESIGELVESAKNQEARNDNSV